MDLLEIKEFNKFLDFVRFHRKDFIVVIYYSGFEKDMKKMLEKSNIKTYKMCRSKNLLFKFLKFFLDKEIIFYVKSDQLKNFFYFIDYHYRENLYFNNVLLLTLRKDIGNLEKFLDYMYKLLCVKDKLIREILDLLSKNGDFTFTFLDLENEEFISNL